ncbi:MAG: restriction endonuclease subunit S [Methylobacter sp.]|nr:restriction endonuclease subunit S [Candidatus Methylobacter titanis]
MSQFKFSSQVDKNKIFIVQKSEIEGRVDPYFYNPNFRVNNRNLFKTLNEFSRYILHPPEYLREFSDGGVQLIRSQNVRPAGISIDENPVFFSAEFLKDKKHSFAKKGDVLIVRSGVNAGDVAVIEVDMTNAIVGADTLLCRCSDNLIPKFLQVYFYTDFGKAQILKHITGTTNKHLNGENLKKVLIPNITLEAQRKTISIFEKSLEVNRQKEQQAKLLLAGIDAYLLTELGITLPQQDNTFPKRIFKSNFSELIGQRFDPSWYFNFHYRIEGGKFPNFSLGDIAFVSKGQSISSAKIEAGLYPVVAGGQSSPYKHHVFNHEGNVITVSASGAYAGYVWYHETPIFASDCSVIGSKNEDEIKTLFLAEILKLKQKEIYYLQQGAGQPHVYSRDLIRLKIPVPPKSIQLKILRHIDSIRTNAKQLQTEAAQILADAKAEIECMILGE